MGCRVPIRIPVGIPFVFIAVDAVADGATCRNRKAVGGEAIAVKVDRDPGLVDIGPFIIPLVLVCADCVIGLLVDKPKVHPFFILKD